MDAIDISNFDAFQRQKQNNIKLGLVMGSIVFILACLYFLYIYFEPKTNKKPKTVGHFLQANNITAIPATLKDGQVFLNNTPQQNPPIPNGYIRQQGQGFNPNGGQYPNSI